MGPMAARGARAPIFVVGSPRSGTTLLAAMLGAHPRIDCGPETLFFPRLEEAGIAAVTDPARWPDAGTDFVMSLQLRDVSVAGLFGVDRAWVRAALADRRPSVAALLESLTAARAAAHDRERWAEKTPRHLLSLPLIRRTWPDAAIIRVVRDPRDVALSTSRVPFASDSVAANLVTVARQYAASNEFFDHDANAVTIRYEDLVTDPEPTLRRLCDFLAERYYPSMLERPDAADGLAAEHEWWKQKAAEPIDPSRAGAWRGEMTPEDVRFAALICREQLDAFGYEGSRQPTRSVAVVPWATAIVDKHEDLVRDLAERDIVIAEPAPRRPAALARYRDLVFWGRPDRLGLDLGRGPARRALALLLLAAGLTWRRLSGRPALWVRRYTLEPESRRRGDLLAGRIVRVLARKVDPADLEALLR